MTEEISIKYSPYRQIMRILFTILHLQIVTELLLHAQKNG